MDRDGRPKEDGARSDRGEMCYDSRDGPPVELPPPSSASSAAGAWETRLANHGKLWGCKAMGAKASSDADRRMVPC